MLQVPIVKKNEKNRNFIILKIYKKKSKMLVQNLKYKAINKFNKSKKLKQFFIYLCASNDPAI